MRGSTRTREAGGSSTSRAARGPARSRLARAASASSATAGRPRATRCSAASGRSGERPSVASAFRRKREVPPGTFALKAETTAKRLGRLRGLRRGYGHEVEDPLAAVALDDRVVAADLVEDLRPE